MKAPMRSDAAPVDGQVDLGAHLMRMRALAALGLLLVAVALLVAMVARGGRSASLSPLAVTLLAIAACLWLGLTANRDARERLELVKRAFAVHGDQRRLLRDHLLVYLVVLLRLECMAVCAVVIALWGTGRTTALWFFLITGLMVGLTWPNRRKIELLIARAKSLRP